MKNKNIKFNTEMVILISIISLFFTIVGVAMSYLTIRSSENIAIKSGAFHKPNAILLLGNELLSPDSPQDLVFGISSQPNSIFIGRLPLVLKNSGEKTLKHISITIRYPNIVNIAVPDELSRHKVQGPYFKDFKRKVDRIGNFDYSSIYLEDIDPGRSIFVGDIFSLQNTKVNDSITIEKQNFSISYELYFSIDLLISVGGEDIQTRDYRINLFGFDAKNMDDVKSEMKRYLSKTSSEIRRKSNILQYLSLWLTEKKRKVVMVYPAFTQIKVPDSRDAYIFFPTANPSDDSILIGSYKLFRFSKVFSY